MTDETGGAVLAVLLAVLLLLSRSTFLQLLGVGVLVWRFGFGGCQSGLKIPGVC